MKVIITGMHRSGTSLVAGLLQLCGLYLGNNLLRGLADNPRGHFEDRDFLRINAAIFTANAGEWGMPPKQITVMPPRIHNGMQAFLHKWPADRVVGWKDPRACLTLPLWKALIEPEPLKVVLTLRPARAIAASLQQRNRFSMRRGLSLTAFYLQRVRANLEGVPFMETHYDAYFDNWHAELSKVCGFLGLQLPHYTAAIEDFIDPQLRHHKGGNA